MPAGRGGQTVLALAAGVALAAAFAPHDLWPLAIAAPAVLMAMWSDATPRRAAWLGFCFAFGTFAAGTWWLYVSVRIFGQAPLWLALLLMVGLVSIMALYHALLGWAVARFLPTRGALGALVAMPAAWVLVEWWRSWFLSGFGWLAFGYSQADTPLAGFAPLGGVHLLSWLLLVMAGACVLLWRGSPRQRLIALAALLTPWPIGAGLERLAWTREAGAPVEVAVLQGAVPQDLKWLERNRDATLELYGRLAREALGTPLIVMPEAALPDLANNLLPWLRRLAIDAGGSGSDLVLGILRAEPGPRGEDEYFNSVLALGSQVAWYDKHHLVPFAEFFPVPDFVRRWLRLMSLPYSDFTRGARWQPPLPAAGLLLSASVCYEDAYPTTQLEATRASTALVNVTNDAWFGRSSARYQHLQISRLRAIEARRWLIRAANDGVSALIGPDGRLAALAPEYEPAVLRGAVQARTGATPYLYVGNYPVVLLCGMLGAVAALRRRRLGRAGGTAARELSEAIMVHSNTEMRSAPKFSAARCVPLREITTMSNRPLVHRGLGAVVAVLLFSACSPQASTAAGTAQPNVVPSGAPVQPSPPSGALVQGLPDFAPLVERYGPAVVNVSVVQRRQRATDIPGLSPNDPFYEFFRRFQGPRVNPPPARGEGSGFIVSEDGYILTNAHVVDQASEVTVKLTDRREFTAKVVGVDKRTDVAVLKIDAKGLPTVRLGDPERLRPGEWVIAIGSPFGFDNSVTAGIVSAKSRSLPGEDSNYVPFIQTDVAVNPGNSGGPLFNLAGEVVGINSQIYSRTGGYMGLSFAIPIDLANNIKEQLIKTGRVSRGRIGVSIQDVNAQFAESFGLDRPRGALVGSVEEGGPAAKAGVKAGDIIIGVAGRPVERSSELPAIIASIRPGTETTLEVWRDRSVRKLTVKVAELEERTQRTASRGDSSAPSSDKLGLVVRELTAQEQRAAGTRGSLYVEDVEGPAAEAGVQPGDVILGVNGQSVKTLKDLEDATAKAGKTVALLIQREDAQIFIPIRIG